MAGYDTLAHFNNFVAAGFNEQQARALVYVIRDMALEYQRASPHSGSPSAPFPHQSAPTFDINHPAAHNPRHYERHHL